MERVHSRILSFRERARRFFYQVMLSACACPVCAGRLRIVGPGRARCGTCQSEIDLTATFQKSACCQARLELRRQHYACSCCGQTIPSRFLFDERAFDSQYFKLAMRKSRENKERRLAKLKELLASSRSNALALTEMSGLNDIPGLTEDLDAFLGSMPQVELRTFQGHGEFVMDAYREAILGYLGGLEVMFSNFPALCEDVRVDRARRFVTLIYMEHEREVVLTQYGDDILVERHEADYEG